MSTIKSSAEDLTLNADGANNDVIIQSNGSTKVTVDGQNSRVGIGTATPASELHISDSGGCTLTMTGESVVSSITAHGGGFNYNAAASKYHTFVVDGTDEVKISGDGILFGSDTAAANALDDYEEGTFTPTLVTGTLSGATGFYTKIGKMCHFQINIANFSDKTTNANIIIQGLPFTQGISSGVGSATTYQVGNSNVLNIVTGSTTQFVLRYAVNASSWANLKHNTLGGDPNLHLVGAYRTT